LRYYTLKTFSVVLFAITGLLGLYILSPLDLLPDLIPIAGQVDDAGALIAALIAGISAFISSRSAGSADVYDVQSEPQGRKALPSGKHR
jgi:uncharacterized membrane protein YkvA (DUF1232 family)